MTGAGLGALWIVGIAACIGGAVFLAHNGDPGWGWLIVLAFIMAGSIRIKSDPKP